MLKFFIILTFAYSNILSGHQCVVTNFLDPTAPVLGPPGSLPLSVSWGMVYAADSKETAMDILPLALAALAVGLAAAAIFFLRTENARARRQAENLSQAQAELAGRY